MQDKANPDNGKFNVKLDSITDSNNTDILAEYVAKELKDAEEEYYRTNNINPPDGSFDAVAAENEILGNIFGTSSEVTSKYSMQMGTYENGVITIKEEDGTEYTLDLKTNPEVAEDNGVLGYNFSGGTSGKFVSLADLFGVGSDTLASYGITTAAEANSATDENGNTLPNIKLVDADGVNFTEPYINITYFDTIATANYSTADGTFRSISVGDNTGDTAMFNVTALGADNPNGNPFEDITVDFTKTMNYDNGGKSTFGIEKGSPENSAIGYGKKLGTLTGVSIDGSGKIYGSYDNGNTMLLGQIAVAQFANASGLESLGNNVYGTTLNSGEFDGIGVDVTADGGSMATGQLEMSNVDLSQEFTSMITTQRGFQANSRIITVSDTMLEELTNLKR